MGGSAEPSAVTPTLFLWVLVGRLSAEGLNYVLFSFCLQVLEAALGTSNPVWNQALLALAGGSSYIRLHVLHGTAQPVLLKLLTLVPLLAACTLLGTMMC